METQPAPSPPPQTTSQISLKSATTSVKSLKSPRKSPTPRHAHNLGRFRLNRQMIRK